MRKVQDYLRELERVKLIDAYFEYAPDDKIFGLENYSEEQKAYLKHNKMDGFIQYLVDMEPEVIGNGKTYILYAYPDYNMRGREFNVSHALVCKEELLTENEQVTGYFYDTSSHAEIVGLYVSDAPYTKEHLYELMGQVLVEALSHGFKQENLRSDYRGLQNVQGIWYRNWTEYIDFLQECSLSEVPSDPDENEIIDVEQMKYWCNIRNAIIEYENYCSEKELSVLKDLLEK